MSTHAAVQLCCYCFPRLCEPRPQPILHLVSIDQELTAEGSDAERLLCPPKKRYHSRRHCASVWGQNIKVSNETQLTVWHSVQLHIHAHKYYPPVHPSQTGVTPPAQ